ncbi:hypothetical protein, partial [Pseudoalteromonas sp. MMG007]|uniref:TubC N-terminal docking domain-related protein n=1 Tax=Pseudoalteromonas sp. MMG007 TaxID=2822684 RepID=UPI001B3881AA
MLGEILLEAAKNGIHLFVKNGKLSFTAAKGALTDDLKAAIIKNKTELIEILNSQQQALNKLPSIEAISRDDISFKLSFAQRRLWLVDQIEEDST